MKKKWELSLYTSLAACFLLLYYSQYHVFHYSAAPGGDIYTHALLTQDLAQQGWRVFFQGYPHLFHALVLGVWKISGWRILTVMLYLVPLVMLSVSVMAAWVARLVAGKAAGVLTAFLLLFAADQPWQTLYDGGFPNVLSAGIWLPLCLGSIILYHRQRKKIYLIGIGGAVLLMACTHHFSLLYLLAILITLAFYRPTLKRSLSILGGVAVGVLLIERLSWLHPLKVILDDVIIAAPHFPWFQVVGHLDNPNALWHPLEYPFGMGTAIFYLGMGGLALLLYRLGSFWSSRIKPSSLLNSLLPDPLAAFLLVSWLLVLLIGSRLTLLGFPVRLARDAGLPMAIAAGIAMVGLWHWFRQQGELYGQVLIILLLSVFLSPNLQARWHRITHYEPTMLYGPADDQAQAAIGPTTKAASLDHPLPAVMASNITVLNLTTDPHNPYFAFSRSDLRPYQYVFYQVYNDGSYNGEKYRPILEDAGLKEVARFSDPTKQVILFQR